MDPLDPQSDDPALRDALRRALGGETAPASLRMKVAAALNAEADAPAPRKRSPVYAWAALLLVTITAVYWFVIRNPELDAPQWFARAMVTTHDRCASLTDHHLFSDIQRDDPVVAGKAMSDKLGYPILAPNPGDGWKFMGAGVCKVANVDAAHFMYTRGDETISIFSMRSNILGGYGPPGDAKYAQTESAHPIAGYIEHDVIHCLVGTSKSGTLSLRDIMRLRDKWRQISGMTVSVIGAG